MVGSEDDSFGRWKEGSTLMSKVLLLVAFDAWYEYTVCGIGRLLRLNIQYDVERMGKRVEVVSVVVDLLSVIGNVCFDLIAIQRVQKDETRGKGGGLMPSSSRSGHRDPTCKVQTSLPRTPRQSACKTSYTFHIKC
jgi:hypothetical protein